MDPLSQLPLECLHVIISHLIPDPSKKNNNHGHLFTLTQLLRVNKYLASAVLPFIYSNPFPCSFNSMYVHSDSFYPVEAYRFLLRMLLLHPPFHSPFYILDSAQRPSNSLWTLPDSVVLLLRPESIFRTKFSNCSMTNMDLPGASSLDYVQHIRHLSIDITSIEALHHLSIDDIQADDNFRQRTEFTQFQQSLPLATFYADLLPPEGCKDLVRHIFLYREVVWAIANPIFEQLQTLTLPVSDIERYIKIVSRMESLEHLQFFVDELWTHAVFRYKKSTQERKSEALLLVLDLVRNHVQHFPQRLQKVSSCYRDSQSMKQIFPISVQLEIFRLLPPARRMTLLDNDNWMQFAAHPMATDLQYLETFNYIQPAEEWFGSLYDYRLLFKRCRSLKSLKIPATGRGSFKWAVQEMKDLEKLEKSNSNRTIMDIQHGSELSRQGLQSTYSPQKLVPLAEFSIVESRQLLTDEVDDVAFAFSRTLAKITIYMSREVEEMHWLHIGRGWVNLPMLTYIYINTQYAHLVIDPEMLTHCPNLTSLTLTDKTYGYRCQDIVPCQAASLKQLQELVLVGWSALTFHHETLHSATKLTLLEIRMDVDVDNGCYIPPPAELKWSYGIEHDCRDGTEFQDPPAIVRPQWTWDWYLPNLTDLILTSEFAYYIQFQLLPYCPSLETLSLDMHSIDNDTLIMIPEDLVAPSILGDPLSPPTRIVVSTLQLLRLRGRWIMDDAYMLDFMTGMFPNVKEWYLDGWEDITLKGLIQVLRNKVPENHYQNVFTSLPLPTKLEEEEYRMVLEPNLFIKELNHPIIVHFYNEPYGTVTSSYRLLP